MDWAKIQRRIGSPKCVNAYQESLDLSEKIGDTAGSATCALNLGHACKDLTSLRDLDMAQRWYERSLELRAVGDQMWRGKCLDMLGVVHYERFEDAQKTGHPQNVLLEHLNAALNHLLQALALFPPDAVGDLALTHNNIGNMLLLSLPCKCRP